MNVSWKRIAAGLSAIAVASLVGLHAHAEDKDGDDADLVVLDFELPEPFFGGTPIDYWDENLEPQSYKDREPFKAPAGTTLLSQGKPVTSSYSSPRTGRLEQITDGDKDYAKSSLVELGEGVQWVQIDLEDEHELYAILVWHFHEGNRVYFDVVVQVSNDPEFKDGVTTVFNNDVANNAGLGVGEDMQYHESYEGRLMPVDGVKGRYVRLYSNGNTDNDFNHYVEVEVWGL